MGAPVMITTTVLKTRTARKILALAAALLVFLAAVAVAPLLAVPLALATHALPAPPSAGTPSTPIANGEWGYPLAGEFTKGRGFGYNPVEGCSYCSRDHLGYDMAQGCGSTIYAAGPGTVITAGLLGGWGNTVRLDHGDGLVSLYGHMQWESLHVRVGDTVTAGTPLGAEGNTGNSFGCHLHFEIRIHDAPTPPEPFMADLGLPLP